jgi:hypothetical protein
VADGEVLEDKEVEPGAIEPRAGGGLEGIVIKTRQVAPRALQIRKKYSEKNGDTRGCGGRSSWFRGLGRQPHAPQCRARFEELLKSDARIQDAERRKAEFEDKMREKAAKKTRRQEERAQRRGRESEVAKDLASERVPGCLAGSSSSSAGPSVPVPAEWGAYGGGAGESEQ